MREIHGCLTYLKGISSKEASHGSQQFSVTCLLKKNNLFKSRLNMVMSAAVAVCDVMIKASMCDRSVCES